MQHTRLAGYCLITVSVVILFGCSEEYKQWKSAKEANSINTYLEYVEKFPNSNKIEAAKRNIEILRYRNIISNQNTDSIRAFLTLYSKGQYTDSAATILDKIVWNQVLSKPDLESIRNYLKKFEYGLFVDSAKMLLEEYLWAAADSGYDIAAYDAYIAKFPKGKYSNQCMAKIDELKVNCSSIKYKRIDKETILATSGIPYNESLSFYNEQVIRIANVVGGVMMPEKGSASFFGGNDAINCKWLLTKQGLSVPLGNCMVTSKFGGAYVKFTKKGVLIYGCKM
jgi:hypothetical protein